MASERDMAFLQILREEKNISNFLDAFFGFLYRCTDFYIESEPEKKLGFPPGVAEKVVHCAFKKWKLISKNQDGSMKLVEESEVPSVAQDIEVCEESQTVSTVSVQSAKRKPGKDPLADCYNGAIRENYTWSQSINDLDVLIRLPSSLKTAKDMKVSLESQHIKVEGRTSLVRDNQETEESSNSEWTSIFEGELCFKTKKDESVWSIVPGQYINIHLEKASERWWEALIVGEPKIELNKIDCSKNIEDMGSEEQMKVQELMWNQQQKLLGKPTSEQIKMENILKKAWNAKGSPFEGTSYDPSLLQFR